MANMFSQQLTLYIITIDKDHLHMPLGWGEGLDVIHELISYGHYNMSCIYSDCYYILTYNFCLQAYSNCLLNISNKLLFNYCSISPIYFLT